MLMLCAYHMEDYSVGHLPGVVQHCQRHQDSRISYRQLPRIAQLNVRCDFLAKRHLGELTTVSTTLDWHPPLLGEGLVFDKFYLYVLRYPRCPSSSHMRSGCSRSSLGKESVCSCGSPLSVPFSIFGDLEF